MAKTNQRFQGLIRPAGYRRPDNRFDDDSMSYGKSNGGSRIPGARLHQVKRMGPNGPRSHEEAHAWAKAQPWGNRVQFYCMTAMYFVYQEVMQ